MLKPLNTLLLTQTVVLISVSGLSFGCASSDQASLINQSAYAKANHALYAGLPIYPGAALKSKSDSPYHQSEADNAPIAGIVSVYVLRLPASATVANVAAFYQAQLSQRGWRLRERLPGLQGHAGPVLNFERRQAVVSINLEGGFGQELEIDLDKGRKGSP